MPRKLPPDTPRKSPPRKPPDVWDKEAIRLVELAMLKQRFDYEALSAALKDTGGGTNTPQALKQRISRGGFNLGFALRVLRAMGVDALDISDIELHTRKPPGTRRG